MDSGRAAFDTAKNFGSSVVKTASNAWNSVANFVDKYKAEISMTVRVMALAAGTIATVGARRLGALAEGRTGDGCGSHCPECDWIQSWCWCSC
jgi:hypothetical protein